MKGYFEGERVYSLEFLFTRQELEDVLEDLKFVPDPSEATSDLIGILSQVGNEVE